MKSMQPSNFQFFMMSLLVFERGQMNAIRLVSRFDVAQLFSR